MDISSLLGVFDLGYAIPVLGFIILLFDAISNLAMSAKKYLVIPRLLAAVAIIAIGINLQMSSSVQAKEQEQAKIEIQIFAEISEGLNTAIESIYESGKKAEVMRAYAANYRFKEQFPKVDVNDLWEYESTEKEKEELSLLIEDVKTIKSVARMISRMSLAYGDLVPEEIVDWAKTTLEIKRSEIDLYLDPLKITHDIQSGSKDIYFSNTHQLLNFSLGRMRLATALLRGEELIYLKN